MYVYILGGAGGKNENLCCINLVLFLWKFCRGVEPLIDIFCENRERLLAIGRPVSFQNCEYFD